MKLDLSRLSLPSLDAIRGDVLAVLGARQYRPLLLGALVAVAALVGWYLAIAQPAAARIEALTVRAERAERELKTLGNAAPAEALTAKVTALEAEVRTALGRMSQDVQLVQILKELSTHAARYRIAVERIDVKPVEVIGAREATPAPGGQAAAGARTEPSSAEKSDKPKPAVEVRTHKLELALHCPYEAVARFLDDLKTLPAFVLIDTLEVEREPSGFPQLRVLLVLKFHSTKQKVEELLKT